MTKSGSVRRAPIPKIQRGFQKGKRGPALKQDELDERKLLKTNGPIIIEARSVPGNPNLHNPNAATAFTPTATSRSTRLNRILQDLIQEIGREVVSPQQGWTRIEAVVRRLYADAMAGKTPATSLLLERGWGRVPQPLKVDFQTELKQVVEDAGLTQEEIANDPLLSQLITGPVVEGEFTSGSAPD